MKHALFAIAATLALPGISLAQGAPHQDWAGMATKRDVVLKDFAFATGQAMDVTMRVTTLGNPHRNAAGEIDNAVMILHGTGGSGAQFFRPQFADELYGPGQPLDVARYYVILPDNIGHGASSKPSDGMRMKFPRYAYADMVAAQHRMLTEGLGVKRLELLLGTSMGCMHAFTWGTTRPGFARRLAPFACNAVEIAGLNRMWRQMSIDAIKADPAWNGGDYATPPAQGLRTAQYLSIIAGANPVALQHQFPTRAAAETNLAETFAIRSKSEADANDQIYQLDSSRDYNPAPGLGKITVPVLWINSADDFINPPGLGLAQRQVKQMSRARFVLIPQSAQTKGHGMHTWARFWKADLERLLATPSP